jgi:maleylacetate reductase
MRDFVHDLPASRVVFGVGAVGRVPDEVRRLGCSRVLLVAGGHAPDAAGGLACSLGRLLAGRAGEVAQHVPAGHARRAVELASACRADLLVAFGGGSAVGLAKVVALETRLPILAVPTTYAGSELTPLWGRTEAGRKTTGRDLVVLARAVVYDPVLTVSLPPAASAASGMNALAHLVEGCYAADASPVVALLAEEGVRVLADALPRVVAAPSDLAARGDALHGAWLGGWVLGAATMGLHHKLCHVLGGAYDLPHAGTHAALLPYVTAFNTPAAADAVSRVARALGASDAATGLQQLASRIGAPTSLAAVGFDASRIPEAAGLVLAAPPANPRPVDEPALRALLHAAHAGTPPHPR